MLLLGPLVPQVARTLNFAITSDKQWAFHVIAFQFPAHTQKKDLMEGVREKEKKNTRRKKECEGSDSTHMCLVSPSGKWKIL